MSNLDILSVIVSIGSFVLLLSNYKKIRERILKVKIDNTIEKNGLPIKTIFRLDNLSDYYVPDAKIKIRAFIDDLCIFDADEKMGFYAHDGLEANVDLSKKFEANALTSVEELGTREIKLYIECFYHQTSLLNRLFFFRQKLLRKYVWNTDLKKWIHDNKQKLIIRQDPEHQRQKFGFVRRAIPWTEKLWIYDLRTNKHFTLKTNPLKEADLQDFLRCYNPESRRERTETERFHAFRYDELVKRDKASLDIFWLKDESLEDSENLPEPQVLAAEIVESLETALQEFRAIYEELGERPQTESSLKYCLVNDAK